jgi:hypothetical protein
MQAGFAYFMAFERRASSLISKLLLMENDTRSDGIRHSEFSKWNSFERHSEFSKGN